MLRRFSLLSKKTDRPQLLMDNTIIKLDRISAKLKVLPIKSFKIYNIAPSFLCNTDLQ